MNMAPALTSNYYPASTQQTTTTNLGLTSGLEGSGDIKGIASLTNPVYKIGNSNAFEKYAKGV